MESQGDFLRDFKSGEKKLLEKYAGSKSGMHKHFCHRETA